VRRGRLGWWLRFAVCVIKPAVVLLTRRDHRGSAHCPAEGGVIVAANHISHADPFVLAEFVYDALRRAPRFLAKIEIFRLPVVGRIVRGAGQIAVYRDTVNAGDALRDAVAAINRGECLVIYPEGTLTRDPDLWPMRARTGVARLAMLTGAPVIPVAQWGPQRILAPYAKRLRLFPRRTVHLVAGPPVDLSAYVGRDPNVEVLRAATDAIMADIRALLAGLRATEPPAVVYDPRTIAPGDLGDERRSA